MAGSLTEILREDGLDVVLSANATRLAGNDGEVRLSIDVNGRDPRGDRLTPARRNRTDAEYG